MSLCFPGPILTVSHDRFFLDKLADTIFEVRPGGEVARYTGNWTDWAEKRKAEEKEQLQAAEKPKAAEEKPREKRPRFTYKEQLEFEHIDEEVAAAEEAVQQCEADMSNCGSDYVKLQELTEKLEKLQKALEEKTERWLYLTELQEKIEAWEAAQKK